MIKFLYGKPVKENWIKKIKNEISMINKRLKLVIIQVGNNIESERYINNKINTGNLLGIDVCLINLKDTISEEKLLQTIKDCNSDCLIDGIIVQVPLPKHISEEKVSEAIHPIKDVDGFNSINIGDLALGKNGIAPCTPYGIMEIFKYYDIGLSGKNIVIVGRSNIVGKPMALFLINAGATVTVCNSKTKNLEVVTNNADIVILATGQKKHFTSNYFTDGQIVVDVGIGLDENNKFCGDVFTDEIDKNISLVPSPNGCGQTTVVALFDNLIKAYYEKK